MFSIGFGSARLRRRRVRAARVGEGTSMIHPTAIVHPRAKIARGVEIGPFCIVGEHVAIGSGTVLQAHVVVNGWTSIGSDCQLPYPFATIGGRFARPCAVGERAYTRIGDRTILREHGPVQRGTGEESVTAVAGDDCLLLAYVHIAHNCIIGHSVIMSNLAQLAGHCEVGDFAVIGGQVGAHQFSRIGRYAMVGGASKVTKDVPPFFLVEGSPAEPNGLNSVGLRRAGFRARRALGDQEGSTNCSTPRSSTSRKRSTRCGPRSRPTPGARSSRSWKRRRIAASQSSVCGISLHRGTLWRAGRGSAGARDPRIRSGRELRRHRLVARMRDAGISIYRDNDGWASIRSDRRGAAHPEALARDVPDRRARRGDRAGPGGADRLRRVQPASGQDVARPARLRRPDPRRSTAAVGVDG